MKDKKIYHLFLDDARMPNDVKWIELPLVAWVIVRNYDQFVETIKRDGVPVSISFDHDLAAEHYNEYHVAHDEKMLTNGTFRYDKMKEKTGYHCAKWLAQYCVDNNIPIPPYYLHTMNGIGKQNMFSVLESARKIISGKVLCEACGKADGTVDLHNCPYAEEMSHRPGPHCNCCSECVRICCGEI